MKTIPMSVLVAWVLGLLLYVDRVGAESDLAVRARDILQKRCSRCHGLESEVEGYNVLDWTSLTAQQPDNKRRYVVPGKPKDSLLWYRLGIKKNMPPKAEPQPTAGERSLIEKWIASAERLPERAPARHFLTEAKMLGLVHEDLQRTSVGSQRFRRYLLIHNLHNDPDVTSNDLRLARAAIGKLLNSLSRTAQIVTPKPIDPDETVFAFDLRDVGWDLPGLWKEILKNYPYGMTRDGDHDPELSRKAQEIFKMADVEVPYIRADWLIATGSKPPLYHTILGLPDNAKELEDGLKIDVQENFLRDRIKRAGFNRSAISNQNRLVERHIGLAIYWKSYDFKHSEGKSNVFQFPLGPVFEKNPHSGQAFEHAGSEIVFSLPNGMPAYLLVDSKGARISEAPNFVSDGRKTAGSSTIVTGLSCMGCHEKGIQHFEDNVRGGLANEDARDKVERIFLKKDEMDRVLRADEEQFSQAIAKAMRPYVDKGDDSDEPIGTVALRYISDLGATQAAAELGVDVEELKKAIRANQALKGQGLEPLLVDNGKIKRSVWDTRDNKSTSLFQDSAVELKLGAPDVSY